MLPKKRADIESAPTVFGVTLRSTSVCEQHSITFAPNGRKNPIRKFNFTASNSETQCAEGGWGFSGGNGAMIRALSFQTEAPCYRIISPLPLERRSFGSFSADVGRK